MRPGLAVEQLGQGMQFCQRIDGADNLFGEQAHQRRDDPRELCIAIAVVARAVQLLEEEAGRRTVA